jgi:geranylgeranyl pyrophosphate synthase
MDKQHYHIPPDEATRNRLRTLIAETFSGDKRLVPPVAQERLDRLADGFIAAQRLDASWKAWLMVELHNHAWRDTVAAIPADRRILLMPKCMSRTDACRAEVDELGLLCRRCMSCTIPALQAQATAQGTLCMVAEGFTSVIPLIQNRVVDAVIGVGCLDSLEKAFPLLINHAVAGLAVPLNSDGCRDTTVDTAHLCSLLTMQASREAYLLDYDTLKRTVRAWFEASNLQTLLTPADDPTATAARQWLGGDGKRWRPYLLAAVYMALTESHTLPMEVQRAAVAVECFHKASLVHDDIQDNDALRYGKPTVHALYGVPIAINVGDILLGEGYRLLVGTGNTELLRLAAEAHISLCQGQGIELAGNDPDRPLTMSFILDIVLRKTVPAFEVALLMGAVCAGADDAVQGVLSRYARALGIAYQLQDDLEDAGKDHCPTAVQAALSEPGITSLDAAEAHVRTLVADYHRQALEVLDELTNVELKRLLFRITQRILKSK